MKTMCRSKVVMTCVHYQLTVFTLELDSPTLPPGKKIIFQLSDPAKLADTKHHPIAIKEGVEYKYVSCNPVETIFVFMVTIQRPYHVQS
jgi:hypothetical protein